MTKLWVKFQSNRPAKVPAQDCEIVDDFINACIKELRIPYPPQELSLSTTDGGIPSESDGPLPTQNTAKAPLFLSVDVAEPARMGMLTESYGEATMRFISETTGVDEGTQLWENIPIDTTLEPSMEFVELFKKDCSVFEFYGKASRMILVDLMLREVVGQLTDFVVIREYHMKLANEAKRRTLKGICDYTICHRGKRSFPYSVASVAETANNKTILQCIGQCASIHSRRKRDQMEDHSVYGIHSTGSVWKFVFIQNDTVFISEEFVLNTKLYVKDELDMIYRLVYYIVEQTHKNNPRITLRE